MKLHFALLSALAICFSLNCQAAQPAAEQCVLDLEAIPAYLLENDPGAKDHLAQLGQMHFDNAYATAKEAALVVPDAAACLPVLNQYLSAWRKGHLQVTNVPAKNPSQAAASTSNAPSPPIDETYKPTLRVLSRKTVLLTLNSFRLSNHALLVDLMKRNHRTLASHPNWIIDVRRNDGGADSSYEPLLPWLLADESINVGGEWLATPENIKATERVCPLFYGGDDTCTKFARETVEKMRTVEAGHYVPQRVGGSIDYVRYLPLERHRPTRVAVLIDNPCGSSCEQFLLSIRQSYSVKLLGRRTYGALDYSNVRPHDLPSGQRILWYATSRSMRIPNLPVDAVGVLPDIYLPPPKDDRSRAEEVVQVHRWLEGGSLEPQPAVVASKLQ